MTATSPEDSELRGQVIGLFVEDMSYSSDDATLHDRFVMADKIVNLVKQARIDELDKMRQVTFRASTVVPRVSTDNRNPLKRMDDHISERLAHLSQTNKKEKS